AFGVGPFVDVSGYGSLTGVVAGEQVQCSGTSAAFETSNAGNDKPVTVGGVSLSGAGAGNYALVSATAAPPAPISGLAVTAVGSAANKVYDGTTSAMLASCGVSGAAAGDVVGCIGTAAFDTPHAGAGKTVTVSDLALNGAAAGNYTLTSLTATAAATVS